jgi:sulfotransferase
LSTKQHYFISGLPRSGSTLFSAILRQNPRFHAGISGPLLGNVRATMESCNNTQASERSEERTRRMVLSAINSFYEDNPKEVVFDTNRLWTNLIPQLKDLFPYTKVICCVRDINWIIDSFENMHQKNPWSISTVFPSGADFNVYTRSASLMNEGGIIRTPYDSLKSAICGPNKNELFLLEYDVLCKNPEGAMKAVYNFIGQPYFEHDFNNVENSYDEYDSEINMKGLHTTRSKVEWRERNFILPPDVLAQYSNLEVWRENAR